MKPPPPFDDAEQALFDQLDLERLPRHVAFVMDGNGRWARRALRERLFGHHEGRETVRMVIRTFVRLGIPHVTLYTFSSENWSRSRVEVEGLMKLLQTTMAGEEAELKAGGVKMRLIGRLDRVPAGVRNQMLASREALAGGDKLTMTLAIDYGSRDEILRAARDFAREVRDQGLDPEALDEAAFAARLDTAGVPDPELLIRPGGEQRLSNYLLWQAAYSELAFSDTLWPEFQRRELLEMLVDYQRRDRRFGGAE